MHINSVLNVNLKLEGTTIDNKVESKDVSGEIVAESLHDSTIKSEAVKSSFSASLLSAMMVAAVVVPLQLKASVIDPNDFVNSCFGGSGWIEDFPWSESDAWSD